jgi:hypothetical protein
VHPLAGQGVNLGFGDVTQMLAAISGALETGQDVGDLAMLQVCISSSWHGVQWHLQPGPLDVSEGPYVVHCNGVGRDDGCPMYVCGQQLQKLPTSGCTDTTVCHA